MIPCRCLSSHMMTHLLTWRNPEGAEENWVFKDNKGVHFSQNIEKLVVTQIGLSLLFVSAAVEFAAYGVLFTTETILRGVASKSRLYHRLSSARFTILWSLALGITNIFVLSIKNCNIYTHESFSRLHLFKKSFLRKTDADYVNSFIIQHLHLFPAFSSISDVTPCA